MSGVTRGAHLVLCIALASIPVATREAADLRRVYRSEYSPRLQPLLCEAVRFRTEAGQQEAIAAQARWLSEQARRLGLAYRDAGPVSEIELPGPVGAPVLGLVVHGDVQPPGDSGWTVPPFACTVKSGYIYGRGVVDDKGPLVQALLAMATLQSDPRPRTHTVRLLVGSDEESENQDFTVYLKSHAAPDVTLVLDSDFPVVIGEKAWDALTLTVARPFESRRASNASWRLTGLEAGVSPSIVPRLAIARLQWTAGDRSGFSDALAALCPATVPEGYRCEASGAPDAAVVTVTGRAAHSGMNLAGGRNALVFLANALAGRLEPGGAADLLEFAALAGRDLHGSALGLTQQDPLWGRYGVNVATVKPGDNGALTLTINLRRIPPVTGAQLKTRLSAEVTRFSRQRGATIEVGGYFDDEPFSVPPDSKLVRRLMAAYQRATGDAPPPAVAGGGTYAKRLPNAVAFGMWFPGEPYPGHDVDERMSLADLHRGVDVLLEALNDLAYSPPLREPLKP